MLVTQWTDSVAKGNTPTLPGDQHLVWKDFISAEDKEKNPIVHTSKLGICKILTEQGEEDRILKTLSNNLL